MCIRDRAEEAIKSLESLRSAAESLADLRLSKHVTKSAKSVSEAIGLVIKELNYYLGTCDYLEKAAKQKLAQS